MGYIDLGLHTQKNDNKEYQTKPHYIILYWLEMWIWKLAHTYGPHWNVFKIT